ncbi:Pregnancy-associated plasma protein-A [Chitinophaga sp. YR573]|uniref:zinc metalloprotease n=1 Tax=Chitinophaga sp. YR573 TaxID=1881040 RepID=UPI0008CA0F33|nr:zinc metalloprotease [Chitinophaga sp. YR573]SEW34354.1 Pregnancy-associated plasma protein-A [Chitinophaga sp. YR573]
MLKLILILIFCCLSFLVHSQRNCGTEPYKQNIIRNYPELSSRYGRTNSDSLLNEKLSRLTGMIKIPVVVHVVYNASEENLPDSLIKSQISQLNLDFSAKNKDIINVPEIFKDRIADCQIEFVLHSINRIKTNKRQFLIQSRKDGNGYKVYSPSYEPIKFSYLGGVDALPCTQYLNIWVGNITDGSDGQLLGYAAFPGGLCEYDGVVIYYKCFGVPSPYRPYDKGRTLTHELAHWLNLRHIGGDTYGGCGDDLVADTPPQKGGSDEGNKGNGYGQNYGCPNHPMVYNPECPETVAEMFMNYMDYVDDACMCMFTKKQKDRMRSLFVEGGDRSHFMNNDVANRQLLVSDNRRTDIFTPTIVEFKKYFRCKPIHDTCRYGFVFWTEIDGAKEYNVLAKKVKSNIWKTITTTNNYIKLGGLGSHILYEIKVQAVLTDESQSAESTSFVFNLKGNNPFSRFRKLQLIR